MPFGKPKKEIRSIIPPFSNKSSIPGEINQSKMTPLSTSLPQETGSNHIRKYAHGDSLTQRCLGSEII